MHTLVVLAGLVVVPLLIASPVGLLAAWALEKDRDAIGYSLLAVATVMWLGGLALAGFSV